MKNIYFLLYLPALFIISLLAFKSFESFKIKEKTQQQKFIFYVASNFTEEQYRDIFLGIKGWNIFLNEQPNLIIGEEIEIFDEFDYEGIDSTCDDENLTIIKINNYIIDYEDTMSIINNINLLGYTEEEQKLGKCKFRDITLIDYGIEFIDYKLTNITMHEIGHAIGLQHIEDNNSIMSTYYSPDTTFFTQYDVEEYCKNYYCDKNIMTYVHKPKI